MIRLWFASLTQYILIRYTGAHLAIVANNQWIKRVFEVITIAIGLKFIF